MTEPNERTMSTTTTMTKPQDTTTNNNDDSHNRNDNSHNSSVVELVMEPHNGTIDLNHTALLLIDMQNDFLQDGGFGSMLGNDVTILRKTIGPCRRVLDAARNYDNNNNNQSQDSPRVRLVIHTREGHRSDLTDLHTHKKNRHGGIIGTKGPLGRILIHGEGGHDIIPELYPQHGEPIIDKPGKGSFYGTDLQCILTANSITTLLVCGVTTEVCVSTTVREANDRGYHCIVIKDCCASYNAKFHTVALEMIASQNGIFGSISTSQHVINALSQTQEQSTTAQAQQQEQQQSSTETTSKTKNEGIM